MKKTFKVVLIVSILSVVIVIGGTLFSYAFIHAFEPLPEDAIIRALDVDEHGMLLLITDDNRLYIGGDNHGDYTGVYSGGFRWGTLYQLRRHFIREDSPVLFADNVEAVFPCQDGLLYTTREHSLYYFGSLQKNDPVKIADHVTYASSWTPGIAYLTDDGSVYKTWFDGLSWVEPELIANEAQALYVGWAETVILGKDHRCFVSAFDGEKALIMEQCENMWCNENFRLFQRTDGTVYYCFVSVQKPQNPNLYEQEELSEKGIKLIDLNNGLNGNLVVTESGACYEIVAGVQDKGHKVLKLFPLDSIFLEKDVVEIRIFSRDIYALYADGSYAHWNKGQ